MEVLEVKPETPLEDFPSSENQVKNQERGKVTEWVIVGVYPESYHSPVLLDEVIQMLACRPGGTYVDCTVGGGGHAKRILAETAPDGFLIGIDRDPDAIARARVVLAPFAGRVELICDNFKNIAKIVNSIGRAGIHGVLFDLGVSSHQLDAAERGFSYMVNAPLDMRMGAGGPDSTGPPTAADLVNELPVEELARIIREYAEERWASRIARFIGEERARRPIRTTGELVDVIKRAIPASARRAGPHPAKRTFQALRIAVNDELSAFERALEDAIDLLEPCGRVCVISFHSLEDRIAKRVFHRHARGCTCPPGSPVCSCGGRATLRIITRKPVTPLEREIHENPRSRSAKLRAAEKF
ncbi:MAG: 16S rRNA (cytosine(1402)-N(4))-methyltransferase RsmH [Firmicutes bacterium]|nr:16S rRNA (cytosine(1402)-N(4))-methyltransferase RsmH [Bacillota bacterium]